MKLFVALSAVLVIALASEDHHHGNGGPENDVHGRHAVHKKCQSNENTHVPDEIFRSLIKREKVDLPANFGDHMLCMMQGMGMVTSDGKVNVEGVRTHVGHTIHDTAKIDTIVSECAVEKETPQKTAMHIDACMWKNHVFHVPGHDEHHHHD